MIMKKRLIVMRHAKSSWDSDAETDHQRPLNDRGIRDAPRVGARLVDLGWQPDFVMSSDARRTRETFAGLSESFPRAVESQFCREFYLAGYDEVVLLVSQLAEDFSTLLVLGHNPGWEGVVQMLTRESVIMKTATAALLEFEAEDWNQAIRSRGEWRLTDVIYPKALVPNA